MSKSRRNLKSKQNKCINQLSSEMNISTSEARKKHKSTIKQLLQNGNNIENTVDAILVAEKISK